MARESLRSYKHLCVGAWFMAVVTACTSTGESTAPTSPSNVIATPSAGRVVVTWTDNSSNEAGFRSQREAVTASGLGTTALDVIATTAPDVEEYVDERVVAGVLYRYSISVFNADGESSPVGRSNAPVERGSLLMTLNVQMAGAGSGRVTSAPAGIDRGPDCHEAFEAGTSVVLTAAPAKGSRFVEWAGDCGGDELQCDIEISDNLVVVASFMPVSLSP